MKNCEASLISEHLNSILTVEEMNLIISRKDYITLGELYPLFHPDVIRKRVHDALLMHGVDEKEAIMFTDDAVAGLVAEFRKLGYFSIDKWAVSIETQSCNHCPAYQWVIHREGMHPCRLYVDIEERRDSKGEWTGKPSRECLRPMNVGASYLIAKELSLPEPLVGKLDKWQYDQYCEEREKLCR